MGYNDPREAQVHIRFAAVVRWENYFPSGAPLWIVPATGWPSLADWHMRDGKSEGT